MDRVEWLRTSVSALHEAYKTANGGEKLEL